MKAKRVLLTAGLAVALAGCSGAKQEQADARKEPGAQASAQGAAPAGADATSQPTPETSATRAADKTATSTDPAAASPTPAPAEAAAKPAASSEAPPAATKPAGPPAAFAVCRSCHAAEPGKHGIGPSVAGVYGKRAASLPGYTYSEALKNSGLVWNDATLDKWLQGSNKMVPSTKMFFPGLPNAEARKDVIDYMKTL